MHLKFEAYLKHDIFDFKGIFFPDTILSELFFKVRNTGVSRFVLPYTPVFNRSFLSSFEHLVYVRFSLTFATLTR